MDIPILKNHNASIEPIGHFCNGIVTMRPNFNLSREMLFEIFGNIGFKILKCEGENILEFQILEWSI
jgi:hypothetical protein